MSIFAHLDTLKVKHTRMELQLQEALKTHASDAELKRIKKLKLAIKDEISMLEGQMLTHQVYQKIAA